MLTLRIDRNRLMALAMLVVFNILDVFTTLQLTAKSPTGTEANPIAGWFLAHDMLPLGKALVLLPAALLLLQAKPSRRLDSLLWFTVGAYAVVVFVNGYQLAAL